MANTYNEHNGTGSQDTFAYTFPYLKTTDVKVSVDGVVKQLTTDYTRPSVTTIQFNSDKKPANGTKVRIYRDTDESSANATFYAGSAIKSQDLNDNFLQAIYIGEEGKESGDDAWNKLEDSVDSTETWVSNNTTISTTGAIDARVDSKIDTALTTDVAAGNKITVTDNSPGSGQITIAVTSGSLVNSDINASAAIAGTKISPDFGSQHIATTGTVDGRDVSADGTKLDGIESNATADQTNAEIRAAVEAASDSNVFTDADHSKLNAIEASATADQTASEIKTLLQSDKLTASEIANGTITSTQIATGALDGRYFTETESDARYFQISGSNTIGDGDTFPDNDTSIATTAAINDRIVDLLDDVGGFVPIANETSFPNANPDANNGAGTIVSIKALGSNVTSNGSGVATIANGTVGNSTVTINGLANSTTYAAGIGILVETTSTLNTYTFHRQVPNATEVTTVASKATEIGRLGTAAAVEDLSILGTTAVVADLAILGTTDVVSDMNTLATSDVVSDMNTLAVTSVINNMDTCATNVSNINNVGGSISNVNTVATNLSSVNDFAARYRVASSAPSSSLDTGDLYFDTSANELKVYNGSTWQGGVTASGNFATLGANQFTGNITFSGSQTVDGRDVSADGTKLDGIAAGATAGGGSTGIDFNDNVKVRFGTGNDLEIYHDGTNSQLDNSTGNLLINVAAGNDIKLTANSENSIWAHGDGEVILYYNNVKKFETTSAGGTLTGNLTVTGEVIASDDININADSKNLNIGANADLKLYHDGSDSYIKHNGTGNLYVQTSEASVEDLFLQAGNDVWIRVQTGDTAIKAIGDGDVQLFYDNALKFYTTSTGSQVNGDLRFDDNHIAKWGNSQDLQLWHNGTNSFIQNNTGSLYIGGNTGAANTYIRSNDGEINIACIKNGAVELYHDNSKKLHTNSGGVEISGHCYFPDNNGSHYGAGEDLRIYHDGSNSWIKDTGTGSLAIASDEVQILNAAANEDIAHFHENGAVELYYDNSRKFRTHAAGTVFENDLNGGDNCKLTLGNGDDIQLYHDATNSYITNNTGAFLIRGDDLRIQEVSGGSYLRGYASDGRVELYYDNSKKFETTSTGVTVTGSVTDSKGNLRSIPQNTQGSAYTLVAADAGKHILASGTITVPNSTFAAGDAVTIVNNTAGNITISMGGSNLATLYFALDGTSANRTLATRGMATILFASGTVGYISGAGLS